MLLGHLQGAWKLGQYVRGGREWDGQAGSTGRAPWVSILHRPLIPVHRDGHHDFACWDTKPEFRTYRFGSTTSTSTSVPETRRGAVLVNLRKYLEAR